MAPGVSGRPVIDGFAALPDGKVLLAGHFKTVNGDMLFNMTRLNADGSVDAAFVPDVGFVEAALRAVQSDGKILIENPCCAPTFRRLNADGSRDWTFIFMRPDYNPSPVDFAVVQPDGKIIAGHQVRVPETGERATVRLNADGSFDETFAPIVLTPSGFFPPEAVIQEDGKLVLAGNFTSASGMDRAGLARFNTDGTLDAAYDPIESVNGEFYSMAIDSEGRLLIGGVFELINGQPRSSLARFDESGALDESFAPAIDGWVTQVVSTADGGMVVSGRFADINGVPVNGVARLAADGTVATEYNAVPISMSEAPEIAVSAAGDIVVAQRHESAPSVEVIKLTAAGGVDPEFSRATVADGHGWLTGVVVLEDRIAIGGTFGFYNGSTRSHLAFLLPDGALDETIDVSYSGQVYSLVNDGLGNLLAGGSGLRINNLAANRVVRIDGTGTLDKSFFHGSGPSSTVWGIEPAATGEIYISGAFKEVDEIPIPSVARLNGDGSLDLGFDPGSGPIPANGISAIAADREGKLVVGGRLESVDGVPRKYIARLNRDGLVDRTFDPGEGPDGAVGAIEIQPDGRILVVGSFSSYRGDTRYRGIVRLNPDGAPDPSFIPETTMSRAEAVGLQRDGKILVGSSSIRGVVRLLPDGSVDPTFSVTPVEGRTGIDAIAIQDNGRILIAGGFSVVDGKPAFGLAALEGDLSEESPSIYWNSGAVEAFAGDPPGLSVAATGLEPLTYQWFKDDVPVDDSAHVSGARSAFLRFTAASASDSGTYRVEVVNALGSVASPDMTLAVVNPDPPSIDAVQMPGASISVDTPFTLTVESTGAVPFSYQWRLNGQDIPGATDPVFTVQAAELSSGGSYTVVVRNAFGLMESRVALIQVNAPDLKLVDDFSEATVLMGADGTGRGRNENRTAFTKETGEPDHGGKPGGASAWARWTPSASGVATLSTQGSSFDTLLSVYTGEAVNALVEVARDEDGGDFLTSVVRFNVTAGATYHIAIDGVGGATGEIVLEWNLVPDAPRVPFIVSDPVGVTAAPGGEARFEVTTADADDTYQWLKNGVEIPGATGRTLILNDVTTEDVAGYSVEVTGAAGLRAVSATAYLDLGAGDGVLFEDKLSDALRRFEGAGARNPGIASRESAVRVSFLPPVLGLPTSHQFSTVGATRDLGEPNHAEFPGGASKMAIIVSPENASLRVDTEGSDFPTSLAIYAAGDYASPLGSIVGFRKLVVPVLKDKIYLLVVDGTEGETGIVRVTSILGHPPSIVRQPIGATLRHQESFLLEVDASGVPDEFSYQWFRNGRLLPGATDRQLTLESAHVFLNGDYVVNVSNGIDVAASASAQVTVLGESQIRITEWRVDAEGNFHLSAIGPDQSTLELQSSADLRTWTPVADAQPAVGRLIHVHAKDEQARSLFFRVVPVP